MINLKKHLENKKMDFFIDKKMKILTIFDPSGIEWWFIRK
ncbi:CppA C-terminal domain-containing protein [Enterococcus rivorum]